jgi:hypothetical protein
LARENEIERLRQAHAPDEIAEVNQDGVELEGEEESDETLLTDASDISGPTSAVELGEAQHPARMASPDLSEEERTAVDDLVEKGVARERAHELVKQHGVDMEILETASMSETLPNGR